MTLKAAGVIFDFDGLILDTETPILEVWQAVYRDHGCELGIDVWQHALGTVNGFDPFRDLSDRTGRVFDAEARAALKARIEERNWARCECQPLLPGVLDVLDSARELGLPVAVASSSTHDWLERWLGKHCIRDRFATLCARSDVARVKPEPDLFLLAAERMGVPAARCVVFEDSPNGIRAARRAGMRCVAVPNALTRQLALPDPDLVLSSLAEKPLSDILRAVGFTHP